MESILKIDEVSKSYGEKLAVNKLSIELASGDFFGFLGPNGAGKTTTIKMITGLLRPDSGKITVGGVDIVANPHEAKKSIGYVPDNPYIYDRLTAREFLELVGSLYKMDAKLISERIEILFDLFDVGNWGNDFAAEYSHGMRQKIIMASAMIHDPRIIVIDEPMVGLDPQSQRLVKSVLKELTRRGTTIFMSTHTLGMVDELCNKVGIIHKNTLLDFGTIDELREKATSHGHTLETYFVELTGGEREIVLWQ